MRATTPSLRVGRGGTAVLALAALALLGGSAAHAEPGPAGPAKAEDAADVCTVTDGTFSWGVKESFRSYISGSIANGSWEATDGASYETPEFTWADATGEIDPSTGTGSVSFSGTVHFTGHDGILDLTFANPTVEFDGDGRAALLLDARSTDAEGELAIDEKQEWVGDLTVTDALAPDDGVVSLDDMGATLTDTGEKAFAGFYEAGADLDPLSLSLTVAEGCDASAAVAPEGPAEPAQEEPVQAPAENDGIPLWVPIGIGAVALLVIGITTGMLLGGRKKGAGAIADDAPSADAEPGTEGAPGASEVSDDGR